MVQLRAYIVPQSVRRNSDESPGPAAVSRAGSHYYSDSRGYNICICITRTAVCRAGTCSTDTGMARFNSADKETVAASLFCKHVGIIFKFSYIFE